MSAPKVAMVTCLNHREEFAAAYEVHLRTWRSIDPSSSLSVDEPVTKRPLVLIDPAAVMSEGTFDPQFLADDSLAAVLTNVANHLAAEDDVPAWVAVLRALAKACAPNPEKPDEPTGMGAVVEDADGVLYVGLGDHYGGGQLRWKGGRGMTFTSYDRIAAVRVLSEGVTP